MSKPLLLGAVAYDPKVVPIWDGIRDYMTRGGAPMDYVLFSNYEAQVDALVDGFVDIAWNTNLAYVRSFRRLDGRCRAVAMRDTDVEFTSVLMTRPGSGIRGPEDLKGRSLAVGSRDSGHAAILPLYFIARAGVDWQRDVQVRRFDLDMGKHGDTGASEQAVLEAVASGQVEAGAVGDPFWARALELRTVDPARVQAVWTSPPYHHCNFTVREDLVGERIDSWVNTLLKMDYNNPEHRTLLDLEGLKRWMPGRVDGYRTLFEAVDEQRGL
ncbi:MAG TPA: PhnD/SsuA/transferrin family substrate-binding protein [Candidatus Xenobia bacterium]|jgi:ABC-type phosphate/phosphonate transport system substrate-binding protein